MRRDRPRGNARALLDIGSILEQAGDPIARAGRADAEHLLELLRATVEALVMAAGRLGAPPAPGQDRDAEAVIWLHDLRTPANAIAGWSQILGQARDDVTRIRAVEAIERNAKRLTEILLHPPT